MAGLSLVREFIEQGLTVDNHILVIEKRDEYQRDKIWSFWNVDATDYNDIAFHSWNTFEIITDDTKESIESKYEYVAIDSGLFYQKILDLIKHDNHVELVTGSEVAEINYQPDEIVITLASSMEIHCGQVFDSRPPTLQSDKFDLLQHFKGQHITTRMDNFNPDRLILMDFRTDQQWGLHFNYVLPISKQSALIETTWFSRELVSDEIYQQQLQQYLDSQEIPQYDVEYEEIGVIPMVLSIPEQLTWQQSIRIGTAGGITRPSTGYTFLSAQWYAKAIVNNLRQGIKEIPRMRSPWMNLMDEILLRVLTKYPNLGPDIFLQLFNRNPDGRIIHFLSGNSSFTEELKIMLHVPFKGVFVREGFLATISRIGRSLLFWRK